MLLCIDQSICEWSFSARFPNHRRQLFPLRHGRKIVLFNRSSNVIIVDISPFFLQNNFNIFIIVYFVAGYLESTGKHHLAI